MLHAKLATRDRFGELYDVYGDSFYDEVDAQALRKIFAGMDPRETSSGENEEEEEARFNMKENIYSFENKFYPDESFEFGLFRLCTVYFEKSNTSHFNLLEVKVRWRGGFAQHKITDRTTHCVLDQV
jgi:hypothetical protein